MAFYFFSFPFSFSRVGWFGLDPSHQVRSGRWLRFEIVGMVLSLPAWLSGLCACINRTLALLVGWLARQTVMTIRGEASNMMVGMGCARWDGPMKNV
jgi:hypothetical protein